MRNVGLQRYVKLDIPMALSCGGLFTLGLIYLNLGQVCSVRIDSFAES